MILKTLITFSFFSVSGKINDKERQYYTFRSAGALSRPFGYDVWQIVPEQCRMRNNISNKFIQLWEIILVTLRTRLETKVRKWLHVGAEGFRLCLLLNRHSGVTLTRILSRNSGSNSIIPCYNMSYQEVTICSFRMAGGHYLFLGSYLALFVLYVHISEGRTHIDIGSDEYKQITSASRQPVSREKRGNSFRRNIKPKS